MIKQDFHLTAELRVQPRVLFFFFLVFTKVVTHLIRLHYHGNNIALTDYTASLTVGRPASVSILRWRECRGFHFSRQ